MTKTKKYIITIVVGIIMTFGFVLFKDLFSKTNFKDIMHILSDCFFVTGVLLTCFGLLVFSTNEGTFDMLKYGISKFATFFKRDMSAEKYKTYQEYKVASESKVL